MTWDDVVDVICAGSGAGGLAAAIVAADAGLQVLIAEKDDLVGGVTALSSGQVWMGANSVARQLGIEDTEAATIAYLNGLSQGLAVDALRESYVRDGQRALDYFIGSVGVPLRVVRGLPDYYHPILPGSASEGRYLEVEPFAGAQLGDWAPRCRTSPYGVIYSYLTSSEMIAMQTGAGEGIETVLLGHLERDERCAGSGLSAWLLKAALDRGVEIITESPLQRLVIDDGRVVGALVETPDGPRRVQARRGVVLATGGYDWNADLLKHHEALPNAASMCPPSITGDHFALAADAGAIPVPARAPVHTPTFVGYPVPGEVVYGQPSTRMVLPGNPHSILVNKYGKRFADDSFYPDVVAKAGRFDGQEDGLANWPAWLIFDDNFREKYSLLPSFPGQPIPDEVAVEADDLTVLADKVGIDPDALRDTVDRFNGFCKTGVDPDFGRGTSGWGRLMAGDPRMPVHPNFGPIEKAPFYAVPLTRLAMGVNTAGLRIDDQARIVNARGNPIPGLYAAGNAAAWLDIGGGFNSGIANMRGLLHGFLAAHSMSTDLPPA